MHVFLTGATGYIGAAVLSALRKHGHEVTAAGPAASKARCPSRTTRRGRA
jgi:uncharacterized protein YbjT (DUF2867 family)